jgi:TMEM175 potassium channel family protein
MDTGRLEAFSDGVFAVAITLLVLNLHVRGPGHGSLARQFGAGWPAYAALFVSFFVIGVIWVNHHTVFKQIGTVDRPLMGINLVLLLFVTVFPFPTATLATYLRAGGSDAHLAAAVYGLTVLGVALSFTGICAWAARRDLVAGDLPADVASAAARTYAGGALAIAAAIGVAFESAILALVVHMVVAMFFLVGRGPFPVTADRPRRGTEPAAHVPEDLQT